MRHYRGRSSPGRGWVTLAGAACPGAPHDSPPRSEPIMAPITTLQNVKTHAAKTWPVGHRETQLSQFSRLKGDEHQIRGLKGRFSCDPATLLRPA